VSRGAAEDAALRLDLAPGIDRVDAADWNRLAGSNPFLRHAFLKALEAHGCVSEETGWQPLHLCLRDAAGVLVGAAPLYLKEHSWGEFVFDFAWARASEQLRQPYYPKLVNAIPFTPSVGPRLLAPEPAIRVALTEAMARIASDNRLSSAHALFVDDRSDEAFTESGWLTREDTQFQWHNRDYSTFADFTATLTSEKRKKLLRERRRVAEAGIHFEHRPGVSLTSAEWDVVYRLYANTYADRGQAPYLTRAFLEDYGGGPDSALVVIFGYDSRRPVCMALTLQGPDTLYGRHWGAAAHYHSLHFECCYYQGIERCITERLSRYDAGTQGEHKLSRGFIPVRTRSRHWLRDPRLRDAVDDYLAAERAHADQRRDALGAHVPYRQEDGGGTA